MVCISNRVIWLVASYMIDSWVNLGRMAEVKRVFNEAIDTTLAWWGAKVQGGNLNNDASIYLDGFAEMFVFVAHLYRCVQPPGGATSAAGAARCRGSSVNQEVQVVLLMSPRGVSLTPPDWLGGCCLLIGWLAQEGVCEEGGGGTLGSLDGGSIWKWKS